MRPKNGEEQIKVSVENKVPTWERQRAEIETTKEPNVTQDFYDNFASFSQKIEMPSRPGAFMLLPLGQTAHHNKIRSNSPPHIAS